MSDPLFDAWCSAAEQKDGIKMLSILTEKKPARSKALKTIQTIVPTHYFPEGVLQKRLARLGREKTAKSLKGVLPKTKTAKSGDLGEILATEFVNRKLDFKTPILRLRWKDGRNVALRGDDILALKEDDDGHLHFLKGEVKSRKQLSPSTIDEAVAALRTNHGRPTSFVVNFVVNRLYELNEISLAEALEDHLTSKMLPVGRLTHLLFTFSGNDSTTALADYVTAYKGKINQVVVGIVVDDHQGFVSLVYGGITV